MFSYNYSISTGLKPSYSLLTQEQTLWRGWERVNENGGAAGGDGQAVWQFEQCQFEEISRLSGELAAQTYRPGQLKVVPIPKKNGKWRVLRIPCVRDRVVQSAMHLMVQDRLEAEMEPDSYGYRPGKSVKQAVARISYLRRQGFEHVLDADIKQYFDNIPHDKLIARFSQSIPDPQLAGLIGLWLRSAFSEGRGVPQGAPISPILSNLYLDICDERFRRRSMRMVRFADDFVILCKSKKKAAAVLEEVRDQLAELGLVLNGEKTRLLDFEQGFRFLGKLFVKSMVMDAPELVEPGRGELADDQANLSGPAAWAEFETGRRNTADPDDGQGGVVQASHSAIGEDLPHADSADRFLPAQPTLSTQPALLKQADQPTDDQTGLAARKTPQNHAQATQPDINSADSGFLINESLPGKGEHAPRIRVLYVFEKGRRIECHGHGFAVYEEGERIFQVAPSRVDRIDVGPNVSIATDAIRQAMAYNIDVCFLDYKSVTLGVTAACPTTHAKLHMAQARCDLDPARQVDHVRRLVAARLGNQRALLYRLNRRRKDKAVRQAARQITRLIQVRLAQANSVDELRGFEGLGGKLYWPALSNTLLHGFSLGERGRQEKANPFSVMLDFSAHLLARDVNVLIGKHHLHPGMGMLHRPRNGQSPLAWDLMEPFRAPLAEGFCVYLVNNRVIELGDFPNRGNHVGLSMNGVEVFIREYESWLGRSVHNPWLGKATSWRGVIESAVTSYRDAMLTDAAYEPYKMDY